MSGFEVFGAVGASLVLAQQVLGALRWAREEYDIWQRAGNELNELNAAADLIQAFLSTIKEKETDQAVRLAFDRSPDWSRSALSTLAISQTLLTHIRDFLPNPNSTKSKSAWKKLNDSARNQKTQNLATRAHMLNEQLSRIVECPPMKAIAESRTQRHSQVTSQVEVTGQADVAGQAQVTSLADVTSRAESYRWRTAREWYTPSRSEQDSQHRLGEGDTVLQRGEAKHGCCEVKKITTRRPMPHDAEWRWVPEACLE